MSNFIWLLDHVFPGSQSSETGFQDVPGSEDLFFCLRKIVPDRKLTYIMGYYWCFCFCCPTSTRDALMKLPLAWVPRNSYLGIPTTHLPKAGVIYHFQLSIDPILIVCDAPGGNMVHDFQSCRCVFSAYINLQ